MRKKENIEYLVNEMVGSDQRDNREMVGKETRSRKNESKEL